MIVADMMTSALVTVGLDDSLAHVKAVFDDTGFHHLLVVEEHHLLGIISDRDLLKVLSPNLGTVAATAKDMACLNKRAHQIMSRKPVVIHPEANAYDAVDVFNQHKISCIPVVDKAEKLVGILSWRDIFKALAAKRKK